MAGRAGVGQRQPRVALRRWLAGAIGLAISGAVAFAVVPANASASTVNAELSLSGLATSANVLGGTAIGVHPGDTVDFAPATVPTAGIANIPGVGATLDKLLQNLLGSVTGYQVTVHFPASFPGGARDVTMGACTTPKKTSTSVTFPKAGTYDFTWSAVAISPLCILPSNLGSLAGNQLKAAGIALNASNQWVGEIKVGANVSPGGLSIQLPGVTIAPSLPVVGQLPTLGVPGVSIGLPTGASSKSSGGGTKSGAPSGSASFSYTPPPLTVPEMVVPHPQVSAGDGSDDGGAGFGAVPADNAATSALPADRASTTAAKHAKSEPLTPGKSTVNLASNPSRVTQGLPMLLAIISVIVLAMVTAVYARLYLARHTG